ncbi:MAG: glycosyltransferase family 39 protein [Gemmatimonadota bacterium]
MDPVEGPGGGRVFRVAAAVLAALFLIAAVTAPLLPDEMYYWDWSRHPAAGYFDHPRMIAAAIGLGTALAGHNPFAVRLIPLLCGGLTVALLYASARWLHGETLARRTLVLVAGLPLITGSFLLATPDAPFLAATALTLYCAIRAVLSSGWGQPRPFWWIAAGGFAGLALQSKYTAFLLVFACGLSLLVSGSLRPWLRTAGPWLGLGMTVVTSAPMLLWNADHDWASLQFQLHHGLGAVTGGNSGLRELSFLGGQIAIVNPILLGLLGFAVWRGLRAPRNSAESLLAVVTITIFGCFMISASRRPVEANWPAAAYLPALLLAATVPLGDTARRWLAIGAGLGMGLTMIALLHLITPVLPLAREVDQVAESYGWEPVSAAVVRIIEQERTDGRRTFVAGNRYQETAALAYHLPGQPAVFSLNVDYRPNQYDFWPRFESVAAPGDGLVLVIEPGAKADSVLERLQGNFISVRRVSEVERRRGERLLSPRDLWLLAGWRGGELPRGLRP